MRYIPFVLTASTKVSEGNSGMYTQDNLSIVLVVTWDRAWIKTYYTRDKNTKGHVAHSSPAKSPAKVDCNQLYMHDDVIMKVDSWNLSYNNTRAIFYKILKMNEAIKAFVAWKSGDAEGRARVKNWWESWKLWRMRLQLRKASTISTNLRRKGLEPLRWVPWRWLAFHPFGGQLKTGKKRNRRQHDLSPIVLSNITHCRKLCDSQHWTKNTACINDLRTLIATSLRLKRPEWPIRWI